MNYPSAASIPLGNPEHGFEEKNHRESRASETKKSSSLGLSSPENLAKALEARKLAIPKSAYALAVKAHCAECCGTNPTIFDCEGAQLSDGSECRLYQVRTPALRRGSTKTALKRALKAECQYCGGEDRTCVNCSLRIIRPTA
jgi:hypothetical protein